MAKRKPPHPTPPPPSPESLERQKLAKQIAKLEDENERLREALRAERRAADRWHDAMIRAKCPNGVRIPDGDAWME